LTLPLVWSADGLPIGLQIVGRRGDEMTLFRLARQLEEALPWSDRRPAAVA
jgi:amidase